jgi:hypothetical protein
MTKSPIQACLVNEKRALLTFNRLTTHGNWYRLTCSSVKESTFAINEAISEFPKDTLFFMQRPD